MSRDLHTMRRYDPAIDRVLREMEAEHEQESPTGAGLVAAIWCALIGALVLAAWVM